MAARVKLLGKAGKANSGYKLKESGLAMKLVDQRDIIIHNGMRNRGRESMERGKPLVGQYPCSVCGKSCTCVIELHEHEKRCIETSVMLGRVGLGRQGQSLLLKHSVAHVGRGGANRL